MSWKYRKDKPDKTTESIVSELRARGYTVEHIGRPTDLLVRHQSWPKNIFRMLECKSRKKKNGEVVLDKRQKEQQEFCRVHGVPYVTDAFEARLALGEVVKL
jgi:hypothetical protein